MSPFLADFVAKVENRTTLKISRRFIFRPLCCCVAFSATTELCDRFWINRYGPSRRRALNASAALRIFVRHPKKTFATKSAQSGHIDRRIECQLLGKERTCRTACFMSTRPNQFCRQGGFAHSGLP